jgi:CheY-like chemotaxis protein
VEDNAADVRMTRENFRQAKIRNNLHVVDNGVEVMAFLRREGKNADAVRPDLILLALNIPKKDGQRRYIVYVQFFHEMARCFTTVFSLMQR